MIPPQQRRTQERRPRTEAARGDRLPLGAGAREESAASYHAPPSGGLVGDAYERFLRMPVPVVLAVLWVTGMALLGSCVLVRYVLGASLVSVAGGA